MALDGTYSGMQASVADFVNRADLTGTIPDFIVIGENTLNRRLMCRQMVTSTTLTASTAQTSLPTDFLGVVSVLNSVGKPLGQLGVDRLNEAAYMGVYTDGATVYGTPWSFAIQGTYLALAPVPSSSMTLTLTYRQKIPALASNPSGNWLSLLYPDAYLYAALIATAPYLQNDSRLEVWSSELDRITAEINAADLEQYGERLTVHPTYTQMP